MYQNLVWYNEPCTCGLCQRLRTSFEAAYEVVRESKKNRPSYAAIIHAAASIGDAAEKLHREHKPELYLGMGSLALEDRRVVQEQQQPMQHRQQSSQQQQPPQQTVSPPTSVPEVRQFIVCDHCMAHGLMCNESSVCEQCRAYNQPCIHRWCAHSPLSKDDCPDPRCHYVHMDSVPHVAPEPKWIIFRGKLPPHLHMGRIPSKPFQRVDGRVTFEEYMGGLNQRQIEGLLRFVKEGRGYGEGVYDDRFIVCHCAD